MNIPKSISAVLLCTTVLFLCSQALADVAPGSPTQEVAAPQPNLLGTPEIIVDGGKGTGKISINLLNNSEADMDVALSGVISSSGKPSGAKILFAKEERDDPAEVLAFTIPKRQTVKLWATVTDVWQTGELEAELRNKNTATGDKLRIKNFPLSIKLDGADPAKAELSLIKDQLASITLKNDDPIPYSLIWRLRVGGREVCGGNLTIERNGIALLDCRPSVEISPSRISDLFKNEATEGHQLLLYPQAATGSLTSASPLKSFPVKASLNYFGLFTQQVAGYMIIVGMLILGGLTSLFLSQMLPNRIKRLNIQDQLDSLARTISDFSSNIDSKLQVMTRVERSRLRDLLTSRKTFSPDFSSIVTEAEARISKLTARVALIQQMDVVLGRLSEALRHNVPPTRVDAIEACLERAKVLLTKTQPTDEESKATAQAITEAATLVDALNQEDADFGTKLAQRVTDMKSCVTTLAAEPSFVRMSGKVPRPLQALNRIQATTAIPPTAYTSVDMALEKLTLIQDYVQLSEGTVGAEAERLSAREDRLVGFLQTESWPALSSARLLVRQMKEDIYPQRLKEALLAKEVSIDMDPAFAYGGAPLTFCVCFDSPAVSVAAAREEWGCAWSFGDDLKENGWNVAHYFLLANAKDAKSKKDRSVSWKLWPPISRLREKAEKKPFEVTATFKDAEGKQIADDKSTALVVSKKVEVTPSLLGNFGERSWTEALKLSAALLIAVFGLVAGAREQLLKLDVLPGLIAVFLVGFGADTIKNLLTTKA